MFKDRSTNYSQLGQEIIDGASIGETEQPEKKRLRGRENKEFVRLPLKPETRRPHVSPGLTHAQERLPAFISG